MLKVFVKNTRFNTAPKGIDIFGTDGKLLLADCYAGIQLANGTYFSTANLPNVIRNAKTKASIRGGGDSVFPLMEWEARVLTPETVEVRLKVTNTTPDSLPIERFDVLVVPNGYLRTPVTKLSMRRTGWQSFTPAAPTTTFKDHDPWLLPPMFMPMLPPSSSYQQRLPWMTVLRVKKQKPLLIGFGGAKNFLGMINIGERSKGHRITASNYAEGIELPAGKSFVTEPLLISYGDDEQSLLERYGDFIGKYMSARRKPPPTGWCSWYYYFADVTEKDILENIQAIQKKDLPLEYIQIDDGYETEYGDWLTINKKFPKGLGYLSEQIKKSGRKPGIWLAPFWASAKSEVFKQHPEWFLQDAAGRPIDSNHHGDAAWNRIANYSLDITHPEAYAWLEKVLKTVCNEWKFEYLKVDFLYAGALRGIRYDKNCTSVQAYRRGLELIRKIAGNRFVLGSGAPFICSVGYVDSLRIGPDIAAEVTGKKAERLKNNPTRPFSSNAMSSLFSHAWMNRRLWVNDPDTLNLRYHHTKMTKAQTKSVASLVALGGGAVLSGDNLPTLEPDAEELLRRFFPVADISAHPLRKLSNISTRVIASFERGQGKWHIIAKFNWTDKVRQWYFQPLEWDLPLKNYHIYDLLNQKYLGLHVYGNVGKIAPSGTKMLLLTAPTSHPQVITTTSHLLGTAGDIKKVEWKRRKLSITLEKKFNANATEILVNVPMLYKLQNTQDCSVIKKSKSILYIRPSKSACTLKFATLPSKVTEK